MKILDFLFAFSDRKKIIFVDCEEDFQLFIQEIIRFKEKLRNNSDKGREKNRGRTPSECL